MKLDRLQEVVSGISAHPEQRSTVGVLQILLGITPEQADTLLFVDTWPPEYVSDLAKATTDKAEATIARLFDRIETDA